MQSFLFSWLFKFFLKKNLFVSKWNVLVAWFTWLHQSNYNNKNDFITERTYLTWLMVVLNNSDFLMTIFYLFDFKLNSLVFRKAFGGLEFGTQMGFACKFFSSFLLVRTVRATFTFFSSIKLILLIFYQLVCFDNLRSSNDFILYIIVELSISLESLLSN